MTSRSSSTEPLLEVRDLRTEFATPTGTAHAVNGISFDVPRGQIVGVVGETGCGKSVTIRSLLGLVRPPGKVVGGQAHFGGRDLLALRPGELRAVRGREIGFVAQNPFSALNPVMRIERQFFAVIAAHEGRSAARRTTRRRALAALAAVGIAGPERVLDGYPHQLSGGMAQRVVIAIAMILDPQLVIADEPTTGLDLTVQRQILDLMSDLVREGHRSMLLVTHDLGVVAQYCDQVVVMYAGTVVEDGPVRKVLKDPIHPYTRALLAAIPRRGHELVHLKGRLPDLVNYPVGCPFAERCPFVAAICRTEAPEPRAVGGDHIHRCHLPEGLDAHGAA
jgi:oligopeptide/dipeptide ABC transporter ATP-binding protein